MLQTVLLPRQHIGTLIGQLGPATLHRLVLYVLWALMKMNRHMPSDFGSLPSNQKLLEGEAWNDATNVLHYILTRPPFIICGESGSETSLIPRPHGGQDHLGTRLLTHYSPTGCSIELLDVLRTM